jgi:type IV pilus assembly protein PilX
MIERFRGAATLTMVMALLLVIALVALAAVRSTLMEERMSGSSRDRSLAFQAAEAALREGEQRASQIPAVPTTAGVCNNGLCGKPAAGADPVWTVEANWNSAITAEVNLGSSVSKPKYLIELLADNVPPKQACPTRNDPSAPPCPGSERRYRITARSIAANRAEVMLQSLFTVSP